MLAAFDAVVVEITAVVAEHQFDPDAMHRFFLPLAQVSHAEPSHVGMFAGLANV
jgi:hypothetical protein